jgi:hypothetical protein
MDESTKSANKKRIAKGPNSDVHAPKKVVPEPLPELEQLTARSLHKNSTLAKSKDGAGQQKHSVTASGAHTMNRMQAGVGNARGGKLLDPVGSVAKKPE